MKDISPASAYVALIPTFQEAAREVGYALAVHGSLGRDLDLVAVPWTEEAVSAEELILRLLSAGFFQQAHLNPHTDPPEGQQPDPSKGNGSAPALRPHGRKAWSIHFHGHNGRALYLDVSVMPRVPKAIP